MTREEYINDEYNRAKIRFEALQMLKDGGVTPEPTPEPTPTPTPTPTKDPEVIYTGDTNITLSIGEHRKFSIYVNNVSSSRDYEVNTMGDPAYMGCDEVGYPTSSGYRLDFDIWGKNRGNGVIKVYLSKNKSKNVNISVAIR